LDPDSKEQVDENLIILSHEEAQHIKDKFYKETEKTYLQALRDQVKEKKLYLFIY
jgi:hypothetical protein